MNDEIQFEIRNAKDEKQPYYWRIWAKKNNKVLAHSENMSNKADCVSAIKLVTVNAATATIVDWTGDKPAIVK